MSSDYLWADFGYKESSPIIEQQKIIPVFCLSTMQKNVFEEEKAALIADEWIHRQYEIDLNFLSPGGL